MDNHPLMVMAELRKGNLLRHPLCLGLVRHKWKQFGRYGERRSKIYVPF